LRVKSKIYLTLLVIGSLFLVGTSNYANYAYVGSVGMKGWKLLKINGGNLSIEDSINISNPYSRIESISLKNLTDNLLIFSFLGQKHKFDTTGKYLGELDTLFTYLVDGGKMKVIREIPHYYKYGVINPLRKEIYLYSKQFYYSTLNDEVMRKSVQIKKILEVGKDDSLFVINMDEDLANTILSKFTPGGQRSLVYRKDKKYVSYLTHGKIIVIDLEKDSVSYSSRINERDLVTSKFNEIMGDKSITLTRRGFKRVGLNYYLDYKRDSTGKTLSQNIKVFDTSKGEVVDSIPFPEELIPDPSAFSGKELSEIDPIFSKFGDSEDWHPVVMGYGEISVSPDGKYIFWPVGTNMQNSQICYVIVISTETKKVVKRIPVGISGVTNVVFGYE